MFEGTNGEKNVFDLNRQGRRVAISDFVACRPAISCHLACGRAPTGHRIFPLFVSKRMSACRRRILQPREELVRS